MHLHARIMKINGSTVAAIRQTNIGLRRSPCTYLPLVGEEDATSAREAMICTAYILRTVDWNKLRYPTSTSRSYCHYGRTVATLTFTVNFHTSKLLHQYGYSDHYVL